MASPVASAIAHPPLCVYAADSNGRISARRQLKAEVSGKCGFIAGADLTGADLSRADLREADLTKADLTEAILIGAVLRGAVLREAILGWADLSRADLRGADLAAAVLRGADLSGADLRLVDLAGTDLSGVDLTDADLTDADLFRADFAGAVLYTGGLRSGRRRWATPRGTVLHIVVALENIFCRTRMPDGSMCNRDCEPDQSDDQSCPWFQDSDEQRPAEASPSGAAPTP